MRQVQRSVLVAECPSNLENLKIWKLKFITEGKLQTHKLAHVWICSINDDLNWFLSIYCPISFLDGVSYAMAKLVINPVDPFKELAPIFVIVCFIFKLLVIHLQVIRRVIHVIHVITSNFTQLRSHHSHQLFVDLSLYRCYVFPVRSLILSPKEVLCETKSTKRDHYLHTLNNSPTYHRNLFIIYTVWLGTFYGIHSISMKCLPAY